MKLFTMKILHYQSNYSLLVFVLILFQQGTNQLYSFCPFCATQGRTLASEVDQAMMIVYGTLSNPIRDPNDFSKGTTELNIKTIIKDHELLKNRKSITLPRYIPVDEKKGKKKNYYLIFIDVYKDTLDPYRGEPVDEGSKIADYLKGAIQIRSKSNEEKLKYFFDYLDNKEPMISLDAEMEFGNIDYPAFEKIAKTFPKKKVIDWLTDPNTPARRFGLYGSMLGHCGKKEDAGILLKLIDDPSNRYLSGLDGILAGYVMLEPTKGFDYVIARIKKPKEEFNARYAILRMVRFFWEYRHDVVPQKELLQAMKLFINQSDVSDLAIEDLRKWKQWQFTDDIVALYDKESHNIPLIKRAILRFVLSNPKADKSATEFIQKIKKADPERVQNIQELLNLENNQQGAKK